MDKMYKCGYCGWLLKSECENFTEHHCIQAIFKENLHELVVDENKVLTVVEKANMTIVPQMSSHQTSGQGLSWEEVFIKHVQDRPPLYNYNLPLNVRTTAKKNGLWQEISNILGGQFTAQDLQKKWKYLRDCYMRAKKKVQQYKPSGSASHPTPDPGFRHYEVMTFLDDGEGQDLTVCSVEVDPASEPGCSGNSASPLMSPSTPSIKKRKMNEKRDLEKGILEALNTNVPTDGVDGFLIRLGESLRRLSDRKRALTEIKILELVYRAEFDSEELIGYL